MTQYYLNREDRKGNVKSQKSRFNAIDDSFIICNDPNFKVAYGLYKSIYNRIMLFKQNFDGTNFLEVDVTNKFENAIKSISISTNGNLVYCGGKKLSSTSNVVAYNTNDLTQYGLDYEISTTLYFRRIIPKNHNEVYLFENTGSLIKINMETASILYSTNLSNGYHISCGENLEIYATNWSTSGIQWKITDNGSSFDSLIVGNIASTFKIFTHYESNTHVLCRTVSESQHYIETYPLDNIYSGNLISSVRLDTLGIGQPWITDLVPYGVKFVDYNSKNLYDIKINDNGTLDQPIINSLTKRTDGYVDFYGYQLRKALRKNYSYPVKDQCISYIPLNNDTKDLKSGSLANIESSIEYKNINDEIWLKTNGSTSRIVYPINEKLQLSENCTIAVDILTSLDNTLDTIFTIQADGETLEANTLISLGFDTTPNNLIIKHEYGSGQDETISTGIVLENNTKYKIILRRDILATKYYLKINNTDYEFLYTNNPEKALSGNLQVLNLGCINNLNDYTWNGHIKDFRIWNKKLTDEEINSFLVSTEVIFYENDLQDYISSGYSVATKNIDLALSGTNNYPDVWLHDNNNEPLAGMISFFEKTEINKIVIESKNDLTNQPTRIKIQHGIDNIENANSIDSTIDTNWQTAIEEDCNYVDGVCVFNFDRIKCNRIRIVVISSSNPSGNGYFIIDLIKFYNYSQKEIPKFPPTNNLIHHWLFDEDANDSIGSANGVVTSAALDIDQNGDILSNSYYFNQNGNIDFGSPSDLNFGTNDFSISLWAKNTGNTSNYPSIFASNSWSGGGVSLRHNNLGSGKVGFFWNGVGDPWLESTSTIDFYKWYHIVLTRNGDNFYLYINNILEATNFNSGSINFNYGGSFKLGWGSWDGANGYWKGFIDNVRIYNRYLTEMEILEINNYETKG